MIVDFKYDLIDEGFGKVDVVAKVITSKWSSEYYVNHYDIDVERITVYNEAGDDITALITPLTKVKDALYYEAEVIALDSIGNKY